jgi:hypothetical protein
MPKKRSIAADLSELIRGGEAELFWNRHSPSRSRGFLKKIRAAPIQTIWTA